MRRRLLYITIDPFDHRTACGGIRGHEPNLSRVRDVVGSWRPDTVVEDLWCARLCEKTLEAPNLLALFLAGSYTDWVEAHRQPGWQHILDTFCHLVRMTSVPILAVCGSHQLVAYAYGGWHAVGHISTAESVEVAVSQEADGVLRAPNPRIGEVGTFLYKRDVEDPIFAGISSGPESPLVFSQWHYDQVLETGLPHGVTSLLRPAGLNCAEQNGGITSLGDVTVVPGEPAVVFEHRGIVSDEECCLMQALRYDVPPAGRVLYSTQFHPDLAGKDSCGNSDHGVLLLHNFLDIAEQFWDRENLP